MTFHAKRLRFDKLVRLSLLDTLEMFGNGTAKSVVKILQQRAVLEVGPPLDLDEVDETLDELFGICSGTLKNEIARRVCSAMNIERPRLGRSLGAMLTEMRPSYW